jgi:hypothetical protein
VLRALAARSAFSMGVAPLAPLPSGWREVAEVALGFVKRFA